MTLFDFVEYFRLSALWNSRITREVSSLEFIGVRYVWCELNFWIPGFTHSSARIPEWSEAKQFLLKRELCWKDWGCTDESFVIIFLKSRDEVRPSYFNPHQTLSLPKIGLFTYLAYRTLVKLVYYFLARPL